MDKIEKYLLTHFGGDIVAYRCDEHGLFIQSINDKPQGCPVCNKLCEQLKINDNVQEMWKGETQK